MVAGRRARLSEMLSQSPDSAGQPQYRASLTSDGTTGYHNEPTSSRAFTLVARGSGQEALGQARGHDADRAWTGRLSQARLVPDPPDASPASTEIPMPPIIIG